MYIFAGGPLLLESTGDLIGVSSFVSWETDPVDNQGFTNVAYYYEWIEQRTGLKLPKCNGPKAYSYRDS